MKILDHLDLAQNQIQNAVAQLLASAPSTPVAGQFYYNTATNTFEWRNNAGWVNPLARASHTGTQLASTISDFDTQVRASRLDQMAAPTADVGLNSRKITGLANPVSAQDAATKSYVDSISNGTDWKASVRAATTANITLSATQTVDGVSLVVGDRVLVKDQSTATQNGLYLVAAGAWTRAVDADGAGELTPATAVMVEEGTTYADTQWRVTTNGTITIGSTAIAWAQIGAATTYTSGTGISVVGTVVSIDTAVVVRKYAATIGDGTAASIAVTHGLGTKDVTVSVRDASTDEGVMVDWTANSTSQVTFAFAVAPGSAAYRVVIHA